MKAGISLILETRRLWQKLRRSPPTVMQPPMRSEAAYTNLEAAYKALALRADMTAIDDLNVEAMDTNAHTAKSWKLVADALEAAKGDAANKALQEAVSKQHGRYRPQRRHW